MWFYWYAFSSFEGAETKVRVEVPQRKAQARSQRRSHSMLKKQRKSEKAIEITMKKAYAASLRCATQSARRTTNTAPGEENHFALRQNQWWHLASLRVEHLAESLDPNVRWLWNGMRAIDDSEPTRLLRPAVILISTQSSFNLRFPCQTQPSQLTDYQLLAFIQ